MTNQHDTPEAVERKAASLDDGMARPSTMLERAEAAAMLRRLHARAVDAERERDEAARLREALDGLLRINEEWNAAMIRVAGRPPNWTDEYLGKARAALEPRA